MYRAKSGILRRVLTRMRTTGLSPAPGYQEHVEVCGWPRHVGNTPSDANSWLVGLPDIEALSGNRTPN